MLTVEMPSNRAAERDYVLGVMLGEFLGLSWRRVDADISQVRITLEGVEGSVVLPDVLLSTSEDLWLKPQSMPTRPLAVWAAGDVLPEAVLSAPTLPVIYGDARQGFVSDESHTQLPIDIFGSAFFMLTRYEEVAVPIADQHSRFSATASLAYAEDFLYRPVVNEYLEVLWSVMHRLWPRLTRRARTASTFVTCDVDDPYSSSSRSLKALLRNGGGDLLKRRAPGLAARRVLAYGAAKFGIDRFDPANTFDWMMDVNEAAGNAVAFYFIADKSAPEIDGSAPIDDPYVLDLMQRIHRRGHEIGMHGSYETFLDPKQMVREAGLLRQAMDTAGVQQDAIGTRQHYLRWRTPMTAAGLDSAGLVYDTTLSFADRPGFRCGVCYPFPFFDLASSRQLRLIERPLIVMEVSVVNPSYMDLGYTPKALSTMQGLKAKTHLFGGEFVLLWHNSHFTARMDREFYLELIR